MAHFDYLFEKIARDAVTRGEISTSYIQRNYEVGFNRAGLIMTQLEQAGIVGPQIGAKQRTVRSFENMQSFEQYLQKIFAGIEPEERAAERRRQEEEYQKMIKEYEQRKAEQEREEIAAKIKERYRRRQLEKIVRQELIDSGELFGDKPKREKIPREIVDAVYSRDGGRCVECGSTENLQLDHIIPFSKGGATTLENLQLLCQKCNLDKSNKIG